MTTLPNGGIVVNGGGDGGGGNGNHDCKCDAQNCVVEEVLN